MNRCLPGKPPGSSCPAKAGHPVYADAPVQATKWRHLLDRPPVRAMTTERWSPRSSGLFERDVLEEDDVVRPDRHIDVVLHGMREHLVMDRDIDLIGEQLVPDLRDSRVALRDIRLGRET